MSHYRNPRASAPIQINSVLSIAIARTGKAFVVSCLDVEAGSPNGLTDALTRLGQKLYERGSTLNKLRPADLSSDALVEREKLNGILGLEDPSLCEATNKE